MLPSQPREFSGKQTFDYFVVTNNPNPNPPRIPTKSKKNIVTSMGHKRPKEFRQPTRHQQQSKHQPWSDDSQFQPKLFDRQLKPNQLAAQQRRLSNHLKAAQRDRSQEPQKGGYQGGMQLMRSQNTKTAHLADDRVTQSSKEIDRLKSLIDRQRREKISNDKEFEERQAELEAERKRLRVIESHLRKVSNPHYTYSNSRQDPQRNPHHPTSDVPGVMAAGSLPEEQGRQRRKQLQVLKARRQKLQRSNYPSRQTSTLIPLLSRASYKIVSTHISTLTELIIDDILLQQVLLLEQIQDQERGLQKSRQQRQVLEDFVEQVGAMVRDNDLIQNRIGRYDKLDLVEWTRPNVSKPREAQPRQLVQLQDRMTLYLQKDLKNQICGDKDKFDKFSKQRDQYDQKNLKMFAQCTEEIVEEMVNTLTQQLDQGSGEFVETIFRHQFK